VKVNESKSVSRCLYRVSVTSLRRTWSVSVSDRLTTDRRHLQLRNTRSSAVAERPRDMSIVEALKFSLGHSGSLKMAPFGRSL